MRALILFCIIALNVFASNLVSMSVSEKSEAVEINIVLDSVFNGRIEQNASGQTITLKFSNIVAPYIKDAPLSQNQVASRVVMLPDGTNGAQLTITTKQEVVLEALKNSDGYKLQLKLTPKNANLPIGEASVEKMPEPIKTPIPASEIENDIGWRYVVVVSFLLFLVAIALYLKKKLLNGDLKSVLSLQKAPTPDIKETKLQIVTQSSLDPSNKLMLVECSGIRYLLLVGGTNLVIDRYCEKEHDVQSEEFKRMLAENERKLTEFLKPQKQPEQPLSTFEEYRIKAEGDI